MSYPSLTPAVVICLLQKLSSFNICLKFNRSILHNKMEEKTQNEGEKTQTHHILSM
jgi:hypothetical protein